MSGGGGSPDPFPGTDVLGRLGSTGQLPADAAPDPCLGLNFTARLRSVNRNELDRVDVGTILQVELFQADRPQIGVFRILDTDPLPSRANEPVGVLLERIAEILPCLTTHGYEAEVMSIDGGNVHVYVHAVSPRQDR
jgi:hypothetical protein